MQGARLRNRLMSKGREERFEIAEPDSTPGRGADEIKGQAADMWDSANELVGKGRAELARKQEGVKQAVQAGKMAYQETAG